MLIVKLNYFRLIFNLFLSVYFFTFPLSIFCLNRVVHVVGDSHAHAFLEIPNTVIHETAPITMHRVGRDITKTLRLKSFTDIFEGQAVVLCYGEIDCRIHVPKQILFKNRKMDEVIETLAKKYIYSILKSRLMYKDLTCLVYSVVPPVNLSLRLPNPLAPVGDLNLRIKIVQLLNSKLKQLCERVGLLFLDIYKDYSDHTGKMREEVRDSSIHIRNDQYQFIHKQLEKALEIDALQVFKSSKKSRNIFMINVKKYYL